MKMNIKIKPDRTNEDLLEYIETGLYLIITRDDQQETLRNINAKLNANHQTIFALVTAFMACQEILKVRLQEALRTDRFSTTILDIDKSTNIINEEKTKYLNSIDVAVFLDWIANTTYWMAKIELKRMIDILEKMLSSWAQWHKYLETKDKFKREGEKTKNRLQVVLGNQINDLEKIHNELAQRKDRFQRGKEHISIDLDTEINLADCTHNEHFIMPNRPEHAGLLVISDNDECIEIDNTRYTLREYYEKINSEIKKPWLYSKDLLEKILIIYLIKRCQNGDAKAFEKLYNFYIKSAQNLAVRFIGRKEKNLRLEFNEGGALSKDEAQSEINNILSVLLKGDDPARLYENLDKGRAERKSSSFLNKKGHIALNESYQTMFNLINDQYLRLKDQLRMLEKSTKDARYRYKSAIKMATKKKYLTRIWSISQRALVKSDAPLTVFQLLNPVDFLNISTNYNKFLFKPNRNGNLTTWLFGDHKEFKGMLWNALSDWYKKNTFTVAGRRQLKEEDVYGESFDEGEILENSIGHYIRVPTKKQEIY